MNVLPEKGLLSNYPAVSRQAICLQSQRAGHFPKENGSRIRLPTSYVFVRVNENNYFTSIIE